MAKHVKTIKNWEVFTATILGVEIRPAQQIRVGYNGKIRLATVERIGEREDGSIVLNVETQDGFRNFDADLVESLEILELVL